MVSVNSQLPPENFVGLTPDDIPVVDNNTLVSLEEYESRLKVISLEMDTLVYLSELIETDPGKPMMSYALEKYGLDDIISCEDINKSAQQVWDRTKLNLRRYQSDLFGYAKVIQSGADRAVERLTMLHEMAEKVGREPLKETIKINKPVKFGIDGKFEPKDIRPLLTQTQDLFDFYDKVLLNYMKDVGKVITSVEVDHQWTDDTIMKFEKYSAKSWMAKFFEVENDERFRAGSFVVRSVTAQGNKAIFFSGPTIAKTETIKDWAFMINTIRNTKLKYFTVPGLKPVNDEDNTVTVEAGTAIRQRLNYLLGTAKRIQSRQGYDKKISSELRKMESDAERLRNKVRGMRTQVNNGQGDEEKDEGRPVVSDFVKDLVMIMNSMTRLVTDYNNGIAAMLRLIGALGYVADKELQAYEAPMQKPTQEVVEKIQ